MRHGLAHHSIHLGRMDQCKPKAQHFFVSLCIYKFYLLFYSFVRKFLKNPTYMGPSYLKIKLPLLLSTLKKIWDVLVFQTKQTNNINLTNNNQIMHIVQYAKDVSLDLYSKYFKGLVSLEMKNKVMVRHTLKDSYKIFLQGNLKYQVPFSQNIF